MLEVRGKTPCLMRQLQLRSRRRALVFPEDVCLALWDAEACGEGLLRGRLDVAKGLRAATANARCGREVE